MLTLMDYTAHSGFRSLLIDFYSKGKTMETVAAWIVEQIQFHLQLYQVYIICCV